VTRRARDWLRKTAWMPCHNDKDVPSKTNQNDKNKLARQVRTTSQDDKPAAQANSTNPKKRKS